MATILACTTLSLFDGKVCRLCGVWKLYTEYYPHTTTDGYRHECKRCVYLQKIADHEHCKALKRESYYRNREAVLAKLKQFRADNPEHIKAAKQRHYQKHAERLKAKQSEWRSQNAELHCENSRAWRRANPDQCKAQSQIRRSREKQALGKFTGKQFRDLCKKYGNCCLACGLEVPLTADHIIPLSKGGSNDISSFAILSPSASAVGIQNRVNRRLTIASPYARMSLGLRQSRFLGLSGSKALIRPDVKP